MNSVNRNSRPGASLTKSVRLKSARLNKIVFVVALLWLVTSALVVFFYQAGDSRAVQPEDSRQPIALQASQPIGLGTSNFHQ